MIVAVVHYTVERCRKVNDTGAVVVADDLEGQRRDLVNTAAARAAPIPDATTGRPTSRPPPATGADRTRRPRRPDRTRSRHGSHARSEGRVAAAMGSRMPGISAASARARARTARRTSRARRSQAAAKASSAATRAGRRRSDAGRAGWDCCGSWHSLATCRRSASTAGSRRSSLCQRLVECHPVSPHAARTNACRDPS